MSADRVMREKEPTPDVSAERKRVLALVDTVLDTMLLRRAVTFTPGARAVSDQACQDLALLRNVIRNGGDSLQLDRAIDQRGNR